MEAMVILIIIITKAGICAMAMVLFFLFVIHTESNDNR